MPTKPNNPGSRYSDEELNPSQSDYNKEFNDIVAQPDMQALGDQGDAVARDLSKKERSIENPQAGDKPDISGSERSPKDGFYERIGLGSSTTSAKGFGRKNRRKIGAALGGGGLAGAVVGLIFMLLPIKIPAIMSMITNEAGQRLEQVVEHRATMIVARSIAQKFATSGSGVVVENGVFKTLVASMRTNGFEKKLADRGLTITKDGDGVRLQLKDGTVLGGGVLKNEVQIKKALESNHLTNKMIKDIVKEEIPTWRWMKRAKFAKWLRHKYGIPRYGITNSQEEGEKGVAETHSGRLEAEGAQISDNIGLFADCLLGSECDLIDDGAKPDTMKDGEGDSGDLSSATDDATAEAIDEYEKNNNLKNSDLSKIFTEALTKKFATTAAVNAIPFVGQVISAVDTASIINHMLKDQAETDYIGKSVAGLKERNYAQLYGNMSGYASQIELGAMRPDYIGKLAEQTEGIEKSQAYNYIDGNTISGNPITFLGDTAYATSASDIPGVPVDRIESNNSGYIKDQMDTHGITTIIDTYNKTPAGFTLEVWYNTLGQGGASGWLSEKFAGFAGKILGSVVPADLQNWVNGLVSELWLKILKVFGLDFNPFVAGAAWFNNAHAGATASINTYSKNIGLRKLSPTQASTQNMMIAAERAEYIKQKGVFYALFSTDVSNSFTNQVARAAPSSASQIATSLASFVTRVPSLFANSLIPTTNAANPYVDLYGVDPYGATDADLNAPLTNEFVEGEGCIEVPEGSFDACSVDTVVAESMLCNFEPETPGCVDTVAEATVSSGGGTNFRIASYNIKTGSSQAWNRASTNNMDSNNFQVVGLQEAETWPTYNSIATKLKKRGYGIYPDLTDPAQAVRNGAQARAIAYKLDKFRLVKTDEVTFNRMDDPQQPAHAPVVWLEDTTTGQQVIVMNTHNPAYGYNGGPNSSYNGPKQRHDAALSYIAKITQLQAEGLPIFFTGDFNEGWGVRTSLNITLDNDFNNLFYCMLNANGEPLVHALDVLNNKSATCNATRSFGPVDHIYVSKGVEVTKYAQLTGTNAYLGTDHDIVPYADVVVPGAPSSTTGASVRVATFNILHSPDKDWRSRLTKSVKALTDKQISIAGLQEVRPDQQRLFKQSAYGGDIYDMYPSKVTNGQPADENPDSVVIWDKSKFRLVSGNQKSIRYEGGARKVNIVKLRYIEGGASGPELYVLNTHDPIDDRSQTGNGPGDRKYNNDLYYQTIKNELTDAPVILTGDFNSKMTVAASGNKPLGGLRENLAYCIMTRNDLLVHVSDSQQGKSGCPSQQDVLGRNDVDHIFVSPSLKASGYNIVKRGINGGDHEMVFRDIQIAGGTSGGWSWPVDKKWWDTNRADFLDSHPTYSGTFTSPYVTGVAVDIGNPPDGSPVYSMLSGKVVKTNLCGAGEGMVIESETSYGKFHIAYAHAPNPRFKVGDTVNSGERILDLGAVGCKVSGGHLHIDMALAGKHICPQDVFLAMGAGNEPNLEALTKKAASPCAR